MKGSLANFRILAVVCTATHLTFTMPAWAHPPTTPLPPPLPLATTSQPHGLLAAGVALTITGGTTMVLGIVRIMATEVCPGACVNPKGNEILGGCVLGVGTAVLAAGIMMALLGRLKEPPNSPSLNQRSPWIGEPDGPGWTWHF